MIISKLLTTLCSRKSGSQLGSGLRRIVCLAALLAISFVGARADVVLNETTFPDANFRTYVNSTFANRDLNLTQTEINNAKIIIITNKNIKSLQGIEYLTALTQLSCNNNTNLTTFDLHNNKKLKSITCHKCKINGDGAEALVNNLPQVSAGELRFYYNETETGNSMTSAQVATAKKKGWTPKMSTDGTTWTDYPGSDAIAIDATNFPDENFRRYVSTNLDKNGDGWLLPSEIATIQILDVSGLSISSLEGIEHFTALTQLLCYDNNINEANMTTLVKSLPNATYLRDLLVYKDGSPTEKNIFTLELLNHARNKYWNARFLDGDTPAQFTDYHINTNFPDENFRRYVSTNLDKNGDGWLLPSEIATIQILDVSGLSISSLEGIEHFTALTQLLCYDNNINEANMTTLVESLPNATYLRDVLVYKDGSPTEKNIFTLELLNHARNKYWNARFLDGDTPAQFTDYHINTNFPDENFRSYVSTNLDKNGDGWLLPSEIAAVTEIDVMDMDIEDLTGIGYFTALKTLYADGNKLTELDLSKNTALDYLSCSDNQLTELDLGENTALTTLYCGGNQLTELDLRNNTKLESVNICNSQIYGEAMDRLIESLPTRTVGLGFRRFYAVNADSETEGNIITKLQRHNLLAKRWSTLNARGNDYYPETIPGDLNGDGLVNTQDIDCLGNHILGINSGMYIFTEAELTNDDKADIVDLTKLIEMLKE